MSDARAYDRAVAAVIDAAGKPGNQTVVLTPTKDGRGAGIAAVTADGSVVMALRDLPATTGTQVYEAWVIAAGSPAPVPVGGFTVGPTGTAAFTTQPVATPPGSTIALSLEPSAGSTTPRGTIVATGVSTAPKS
ncbi:MAG TPA: anti-sigma factor [Candidatus Limnocylindrales bacterium]|nr:anti-sigma factor [Candidatus Limnocylindrales bacterium]